MTIIYILATGIGIGALFLFVMAVKPKARQIESFSLDEIRQNRQKEIRAVSESVVDSLIKEIQKDPFGDKWGVQVTYPHRSKTFLELVVKDLRSMDKNPTFFMSEIDLSRNTQNNWKIRVVAIERQKQKGELTSC